jgi:O-antigen/teichoic acid export membrane protein
MNAIPPSEELDAVPVPMFRKSLANLAALACIQVSNALLPLVAYPIILVAVGADRFSRVVVTESIMYVALAIVIYSFDVEGVSSIAGLKLESHLPQISAVYSEILLVRLGIVALCAVALAILYPFIDRTTFLLLAGWLLFPLSYALQSSWFFQGIERNVGPAIIIATSRLASLLLVKFVITQPRNFLLAPLIIGGAYTCAGILLVVFAVRRHGVRITFISRARGREALARGKEIFVGNISVTLYRGSNVLILNAISTNHAVVVYSIAEKAIKVVQAGAAPLNQVFFPKVIRALGNMTAPSRAAFRSIFRYTFPQLAALALGVAVVGGGGVLLRSKFAPSLRTMQMDEIVKLVSIMLPAVFFGVANFMLGTGGLNYLGRRGYLAKSILATGVCNVGISFALVALFRANGAAVAYALAELVLFLLIARKYGESRRPSWIMNSGRKAATTQ